MFLGGLPRRPDKAVAYSQLKQHLTILGVWIAAIRAAPFVLHILTKESGSMDLSLDD
ncbi:hypothetical protein MPTK1_1g11140 [Marchantia polymorpha subsp. ruderalis]|uniref:Mitochondrial import receptor subunit TOM6 homolog n=2 Tax=Marchantia polymorpha TaxID=3197 RepID=A0AAF6ANW9_MARPO|nr:hypothetical protein MARPO_0014s0113 [Marchantia polymorpha]BBM98139.1 hypothetical protein Mp_1g11140 [Marchantia polymorpha subsp. ruderalis]|eukprot:PTQ45586.1 hypothetical protein MARPO_0014s0113 [Marchantia polymorpha]